ncbi:MAG: hypothetical protein Ct9H300mP5_1100 [Candidatus Pelagibacterales bacterium]|nr:MAG: hypothetical protein Ct9H300mP5_1100 [Pelagibacterales bacterium]
MIQFAGGKGLWAAERLGPNSIRAHVQDILKKFP